jgi:diacylglycerol kinase (ATP)
MAAALSAAPRPESGPTAAARRILVIWNPAAGTKAGLPTNTAGRDDILRAMANGLGRELFESPSAEATVRRVDEAVKAGYDVVVAAGGDGTARSIALRLLGRETALGLLPLGSAMNLARALGIPRDVDAAAGIIAEGAVRSIDIGELDGRPFLEQVSIGLSAEVFAAAHALDKRRWGAILGLLRLLAERRRRTRIELDLDGEIRRSRALALAIANTPVTGLGIELAPNAIVDDGLLDVVVFEGLSPMGFARYLLAAMGGHDGPERFRSYRAAHVRVETHRPLPVRFDAEAAGHTPIDIKVRHGVLRVVVPRAT